MGKNSTTNPISEKENTSNFIEEFDYSESMVFGVEVATLGVGCYGDSTGNAVAQVTDGVMPFQYLWSNGDTTSTSSNLPQGNYSLTVTDSTGAMAIDSFTITSPDSLYVIADVITGCEGGNSGIAFANIVGGSFPFSFAWSNGDSVQTVTNLSTGNYVVTVTDVNGCVAISNSVFLFQPIEVNSNPFPSSTSCPDGMDGSVTLDVWGGAGGYTYNWSNGDTSQNITNLLAGPYSVTVTDTNGCTSSSEVNVDSPSPITLNVQGIGNVSCNGESDGSIFATAFGGNPDYTYSWNNGDTGSFIDSLSAGTFFVTITDATGCTEIGSVTVNEPELLEAFTFGSSVCNGSNDGTANIVASGGTQPFSYMWSTGDTTAEVTNLIPGTYFVTVSDFNQCVVEDSIVINLNTNPLVSNPSSFPVSCFNGNDGTATITPSGGNAPYTYNWSTGSQDSIILNLVAGIYTVTVVDLFNCSFVETYEITEPSTIEADLTVVNATCGLLNGTAFINPTGGTGPYTFEWFDGSTADSLINLGAGTYAVNVTDANGCVQQFSVDVNMENNPPTAIAQNIFVNLDVQGVAIIEAAQINNGSFDDCGIDSMYIDLTTFTCNEIGENTVTLTVIDAADSSSTTTAIVTVIDEIAPTTITQNITLALNENGIATLTAAQIDNGSSDNCSIENMSVNITQFDCSSLGDHPVMLTVMDVFGNVDSAEAIVSIIDTLAPNIATQNITVALDENGVAQIDINQVGNAITDNCGVDSISSNISQFDCSNLGDNSIMLTVMDASGNSNSAEAIVSIIDTLAPSVITQNITIALDENGIAQVDMDQINNGSFDNCGIDSMSVNISQFDCSSLGDNSVILTIMDASGNSNSAEAIVTVVDDMAPTIITQDVTVYLDANGNVELDLNQIDNGSFDNCGIDSMSIDLANFDCSMLGDFTVTLTAIDVNGNMQTDTAIVTVADTIAATIFCPPNLIIESCDTIIVLDYALGDVVDNCSTGAPVFVSGIPSGEELSISTGTVTNVFEYVDPAGNVTTCSFDITLVSVPEIEIQLENFTPATEGNNDGSIDINVTGSGPFQFEWTSGGTVVSTDEDPTDLPAGIYEVFVTGVNGCSATFQVEVTTGIQDPALVAKVNLFPNPTSDILFVKMDLPIESGDKIQLYSIDGKVLLEKNLNAGDELIELNVENFNDGIYIMQLTVDQGVVTKRVIVN